MAIIVLEVLMVLVGMYAVFVVVPSALKAKDTDQQEQQGVLIIFPDGSEFEIHCCESGILKLKKRIEEYQREAETKK